MGEGNQCGVTGNGRIGVLGVTSGAYGVVGYASVRQVFPIYGQGVDYGIVGYASTSSGDRFGGFFYAEGGGSALVGATIGTTNYKIVGSGSVSCIMPTREGKIKKFFLLQNAPNLILKILDMEN